MKIIRKKISKHIIHKGWLTKEIRLPQLYHFKMRFRHSSLPSEPQSGWGGYTGRLSRWHLNLCVVTSWSVQNPEPSVGRSQQCMKTTADQFLFQNGRAFHLGNYASVSFALLFICQDRYCLENCQYLKYFDSCNHRMLLQDGQIEIRWRFSTVSYGECLLREVAKTSIFKIQNIWIYILLM